MPQTLLSPSRRWFVLGVLLAAGALLTVALDRRSGSSPAAQRGDFRACSTLEGEAARECYAREVGRELAAVGSAAPRAVFEARAGSVTFAAASAATSAALLCDLHIRVGAADASKPPWVGWSEPPAS